MLMKIETVDIAGECFSVIYTEHKGQKIEWNASEYEKGNNKTAETVFRHINEFFASLPEEKQDGIWNCYVDIKETFDSVFDAKRLHSFLTETITKLYTYLSLEEISLWINFKSDIMIPLSIKDQYDITDPIDRTYVKKDYSDLILLSLALRPIVPVWSEYNSRVKSLIGNHFKEYQSLALLMNTELFHHTSMEKLRTYVEANSAVITDTAGDGNSIAAIIGGLGTTELPDWLLALSVVRRVAIADLDANSETGTIIANVYKYVSNSIKSLDKRFKGTIKNKETSKGDDEDNASVIEGYKVKQEQSDGDLVTLSVFTDRIEDITQRLQPDLDPIMLNDCLHSIQQLAELDVHQHQITLTQWVIHPIIPARGVPYLNKQALLKVMAISQAVLWHRGFNDLAKLITARPVEFDEDIILGGFEARSLIPKELMDELIRLYPFFPKLQNKQQGDRKSNPASKAIDIITKDLVREQWMLTGPQSLTLGEKRLITPADIKAQLAKFIIDRIKRKSDVG